MICVVNIYNGIKLTVVATSTLKHEINTKFVDSEALKVLFLYLDH